MVTRWCLAALWAGLSLTKAVASAPFVVFVARQLSLGVDVARPLAWTWIGIELLLALGVAVSISHRVRSPFLIASLTLACLLLIANVVRGPGADLPPCGCFGALAEATYFRRLLVCGVVLFLSVAVLRGELLARVSADGQSAHG